MTWALPQMGHFISSRSSMTDCTPRAVELAALNDQARRTLTACKVFFTRGIIELNQEAKILQLVKSYNDFTPENDPYGEHDFGAFDLDDTRIWWKFDYYDLHMQWASPDPTDPGCTTRVLTILLPEEW